jgi:acyl dehydratase
MSAHQYPQRLWASVVVGEELPEITDCVSFTRVASAPTATLDYFPLHHSPPYALAEGHPDIIMNSIQVMGFIDRVATEWAGPGSFVARRQLRLRAPVYPGDTLRGSGRVTRTWVDDDGPRVRHLVEIDITVKKDSARPEDGVDLVESTSLVWLELPTAKGTVYESMLTTLRDDPA